MRDETGLQRTDRRQQRVYCRDRSIYNRIDYGTLELSLREMEK